MFKIPINILIIDDEKDFVEMLGLRLGDLGHNVRSALSGEEGLAALAEQEADVVILDIRMPGMDGITALREIRANHPLVETLLLTGHGTIDTAVTGLKSGAFDYLLKPTPFDELVEKLEAAMKRKLEQEERVRRAEAWALVRRSGDV
jgi:DNA-binding NtrC family response regulator